MQKKFLIIFIVCIFSCTHQITAGSGTPGTLDTTFNAGGVQKGTVSTNISNLTFDNQGFAVALQTDGKIVVAGFAQEASGGNNQFAVARFKTDGTLDTTFNAGGVEPGTTFTTIDGVDVGATGTAVAIQSDGKIVVAGSTSAGGGKFAVARFNTDGTLDPTFNASGAQKGTVSTTIDNGAGAEGTAVAIQSDGKIVVAGFTNKFAVARFRTDGTLDPTFNGGVQAGTASTSIDNIANARGEGVAIQSDGKIVVAGFVNIGGGVDKFAVARFNTDGTLDMTFNVGGVQKGTASTFVDGAPSARGEAVAIQTDGKIVVAGFTSVENFGVARFNTDGTLDTAGFNAFGTQAGTASTPIDNIGNTGNEAYGVAIQTNGKIVLAGTVFDVDSFGVARFNTDGTLDKTFNPAGNLPGTVVTTIDGIRADNEGEAVVIQTDGKIVVAGFMSDNNNNRFAVARFNGDPIPLPTTNQCALRFITKYGPRL